MDEYTFLVLAKLKADRRRLERERRAELRLERPEPPRVSGNRQSYRARHSTVEQLWRN
jgi:hypothetical protein